MRRRWQSFRMPNCSIRGRPPSHGPQPEPATASAAGTTISIRDQLRGLKILDVGCGLAISSLYFAEHGARLTFSDIALENVRVVERLCALKGVAADFRYIEDEGSFAALPSEFDVVLALGSLIDAP
jgi:2-polyprenyl-3-methyl-5-hydroxy-6-metoxy-1,4-benzoquinol methylase